MGKSSRMDQINRGALLRRAVTIVSPIALSTVFASPAMASGLDQAQTYLTTLKGQILTIVPIVAIISMLVMGVMYAMNMMRKETLVHWFIGVILAGSATELVAAFFPSSS